MRYNTIVFDLDGTLLNTLEDLCDSVNVIMERFGWKRGKHNAPPVVPAARADGDAQ